MTQNESRPRVSLKGFAFYALTSLVILGVLLALFVIDEIWSQIVAGIFIAALVIPPLLVIVAWLFLRGTIADQKAAIELEVERRSRAAKDAAERRARARSSYIGPNGLPRD